MEKSIHREVDEDRDNRPFCPCTVYLDTNLEFHTSPFKFNPCCLIGISQSTSLPLNVP